MNRDFPSINAEQAEVERQEAARDRHLSEPDTLTDRDRAERERFAQLERERAANYGAGLDDMDRLYDRILAYRDKHGPSSAHREYGQLYILAEYHRGDIDEYCD